MKAWYFPSTHGDLRLVADPSDAARTILQIEKPTPEERKVVNVIGKAAHLRGWLPDWSDYKASATFVRTGRWEINIAAPVAEVGTLVTMVARPGPAVLTAIQLADGRVITASGSAATLQRALDEAAEGERVAKALEKEFADDLARDAKERLEAEDRTREARKQVEERHAAAEKRAVELEAERSARAAEAVRDEEAKRTAEAVKAAKARRVPEAAATVRRATPSCPACEPGSIGPAREVLLTFLSDEQHESWSRYREIVVEGGLTGYRYAIFHRNHPMAQRNGRICWDIDSNIVVHFHDRSVPPEEEVLAAMLILQHREPWLRNEATMLDARRRVPIFKNPFGDGGDGVSDAIMMSRLGDGIMKMFEPRKRTAMPTVSI